jgi:hypothetical protein
MLLDLELLGLTKNAFAGCNVTRGNTRFQDGGAIGIRQKPAARGHPLPHHVAVVDQQTGVVGRGRLGSSRGVPGKPKPEQPKYNGRENETDSQHAEHRAITKSGAGLNSRLNCAAFFLAHACLLRFRQENLPGSCAVAQGRDREQIGG